MHSSLARLSRRWWGRAAILAAGLGVAVAAWLLVARADEEALFNDDDRRFSQLTYEVSSRMDQAENVLRGLQGVFVASDDVSRVDFHRYANAMGIGQNVMGLRAAQYAPVVTHAGRAAFEERVRNDRSLVATGYPDYRIKPPGDRAWYAPIEFNEPMAGNEGAFGLDTAEGPVLREVLETARDTGQPTTSAPIKLAQANGVGIVIRAPVYRNSLPVPQTLEERRAAYAGQVSVVFLVDTLLGGALGNQLGMHSEVTLTDLGPASGATAADAPVLGRYGRLPEASWTRLDHEQATALVVSGRFWQISQHSRPPDPRFESRALMAGGLVLAMTLLVVGVSSLADARRDRAFAAELESTVAERTAQLRQANEELESFAYSVAHDLRAPARHVHGFARLIETRHASALDETARGLLSRIVRAADDMGRLVDDLLAFSQLGHRQLLPVPVELGALVERIRQEALHAGDAQRIEWRIGPLPRVDGDAALLRLALGNLIGNAIKYAARSDPPVIEVFADLSVEGEVRVCVRDNGVGFDMQHAHQLFKVFSRLHHGDEFEGTGVGLASVRRIIERHEGRIWASAQPGVGAEFWIALPAPPV